MTALSFYWQNLTTVSSNDIIKMKRTLAMLVVLATAFVRYTDGT